MNIINLPAPTPPSPATLIARDLLSAVRAELDRRVTVHRQLFAHFWDNAKAAPDEILVEMGSYALSWLQYAGANVDQIAACAEMSGMTLHDFLKPEDYTPRRQFIPGPDSTLTLAPPAAGYDAHGCLIPVEPVLPEPPAP